VLVETLAASDE